MKKIILALMLLSTFSFALPSYIVGPYTGLTYKFDSVLRTYGSFRGTNIGFFSTVGSQSFAAAIYEECTLVQAYGGDGQYTCVEGYYLTDTGTCPAPNAIVGGECINPNAPVCVEGSHVNNVTNTCDGDYPVADEETLETGSKNIIFEDGCMMILNPDGSAATFAPDGAKIPNRFYNGSIPSDAWVSEFKNVGVNGSDFFTVNPLGVFLKSSAEFVIGNTALLWTKWLSDGKQTANNDFVEFRPVANSPTAVNFSSVNFDNIDFSEYENKSSSTPQTVPNTDMTYQKVTPENSKQFPSAYEGDTVFYKNNDTSSFVASNSDAVAVVKANSDGSSQKLEISKNDLQNTATNNTDLPIKQIITPAPKINADGTTTQVSQITQSIVAPSTNNSTNTNSSTGTPIIASYGKGDTNTNASITPNASGTGSNIDLGGVMSRLDRISNQLTKINNRNDDLDKVGGDAFAHGLPKEGTSPYDWTSYQTTFDNLKSTMDDLNAQAEEIKALFQEGFTLDLSGSSVETCPYNSTITLDGRSIPVSFDLCKSFSPMRPLLYAFFYLFFVFNITYFGVKSILRLA